MFRGGVAAGGLISGITESVTLVMSTLMSQELNLLDEDANVYKMIGPALVKQDPVEAKSNIEKRLEFIKHELSRLDTQAKHLDERRTQKLSQVG